MEQKNLLITGASGFVGSHLVEEALSQGYTVYAGIRLSSSKQYLQDKRIKFFETDIHRSTDMHDRFKDNQTQKIVRNISALRDFGVKIDLDDFGTGDSVLSTISRLHVDELKIDRKTVNTFRFDDEAMTLVKTVVSIAKSLNLKVIAEGVEKVEELDGLRALGCDYAQGYYFMKPSNLEEAMGFSQVTR